MNLQYLIVFSAISGGVVLQKLCKGRKVEWRLAIGRPFFSLKPVTLHGYLFSKGNGTDNLQVNSKHFSYIYYVTY
jgi:hypothetical protein